LGNTPVAEGPQHRLHGVWKSPRFYQIETINHDYQTWNSVEGASRNPAPPDEPGQEYEEGKNSGLFVSINPA